MYKQWHWYVYIIKCSDGLYYTGLTWDLHNRFEQHKSGNGCRFTAKHGAGELVYAEIIDDLTAARFREKQIKDYSRAKKEILIKNFKGL
ncbi:MAG: GIY-YIG nuclease family protein [Patescibacteria group bacterium]|jgi:putative endonuclease